MLIDASLLDAHGALTVSFAVQHQDNSLPFDYLVAVVALKLSMKR
jgi:hypothetical protein